MDRMLYVAMNGAGQTMLAQAINSNNLANVSTTGFRADLAAFLSLPVEGYGWSSRVNAQTTTPQVDYTPGPIMATANELDVAINGEGWIAVQAPDGGEGYTRAGDLRLSSAGLLVNGAGYPVLGNSGPIALPPFEKLEIGADGTISIRPVGQAPNTLAVIDRIKLVNPPLEQLSKGEDGLLRMNEDLPVAADAQVKLVSGAREGSNVNGVEAMVNMLELARQFEVQVKLMKVAEENDAAAAQLMRMG